MNCLDPFRVVGSVCGQVPAASTLLYGTPLLMVPVGRTYNLYKSEKLLYVRGGPHFLDVVSAVAMSGKYRAVAEGPRLHGFVHHKLLWTTYHNTVTKKAQVRLLFAQDDLLFCVGDDKRIVVRDLRHGGEVLNEILVAESETVTALATLPGYTNKLVVSTLEGRLHLYNYKTGKCLWMGNPLDTNTAEEEDEEGVARTAVPTPAPVEPLLTLTASPYKDIVAVGTSTGRVVVYNLLAAEAITTFYHHSRSAVTSLAFRTDRDGFLCSGTSLGEVYIWDMQQRCLDGVLSRTRQNASAAASGAGAADGAAVNEEMTIHSNVVHSLVTFPATTSLSHLLVTASADNSLVQFRFDTVDGYGLLLRERRGHESACSCTHFYNAELLVTAGVDRAVRVTHLFSDRASWELSQGKLSKKARATQEGQQGPSTRHLLKLPPASAIASAATRNYQWASIVTIHEASSLSCGWRLDTRSLDFKVSAIATSTHTARCVAVSDCGNYAACGYSSGHLALISLQNKSIRQLFDPSLARRAQGPAGTAATVCAHEGSVECVEVCGHNTVICSAGVDGVIKYWSLQSGELLAQVATGLPCHVSCIHPSDLLLLGQHTELYVYHANPHRFVTAAEAERAAAAAATTAETEGEKEKGKGKQKMSKRKGAAADGTTLLSLEKDFYSPVRVLRGHRSPITAVALAPDSFKYVASASGDGALLLWDLAGAVCVGQYRFPSPALSLHFHPDALFLASTHAGECGAFLWVNNLRYGYVPEVVERPERQPMEDLPFLHFPTQHGLREEDEAAADAEEAQQDKKDKSSSSSAAAAADAKKKTTSQKKKKKAAAAAEQEEEVTLFDASSDVALLQQHRQRQLWARLDALPMEGITLSGVDRATWFNLLVLDQIKEKNQPILPPKKKDVPFFLPTTQELRPTFLLIASDTNKEQAADAAAAAGPSRIAAADLSSLTEVQTLLWHGQHEAVLAQLKARQSAALIDLEIKNLVDYVEGVAYTAAELHRMAQLLLRFFEFVTFYLERRTEVDLVQGVLADALRTHGGVLTRLVEVEPGLLPAMEKTMAAQNKLRYTMDHLLYYPMSLATTFSGSAFYM